MPMQTNMTDARQLGKVLHKRYEDIANEPLPKRWVELVNFLDQKEKEQRDLNAEAAFTSAALAEGLMNG
jgi:hypothetical protein